MYPYVAAEEQTPEALPAPRHSPWSGIALRIGSAISSNRKAVAGLLILLVFVVMAVFAPLIAPYDPNSMTFLPSAPPSAAHWLGTTSQGQDIFSQLVWGARQTLLLGLIGGFAATALAVLVGVTAAYFGGTTDHALAVFTDVFLVLPALPLMIVIAAYEKGGGFWVLVAVIVITGWSYGARQIRPQALSLRNREFLESARVRGERSSYIILAELLPNMTSLILAIFLGAALYAILAAAGLQFIGLGNPNDLSWGTMLYWAENQEALLTGSPLWIIVPGFCIAALGAAVALLNYGVDELGNPALRSTRRKRGRRTNP